MPGTVPSEQDGRRQKINKETDKIMSGSGKCYEENKMEKNKMGNE